MSEHLIRTESAKITVYPNGPMWDGAPSATLGAFSCKTSEGGKDVLDQAVDFVRSQGGQQILGPMDGDTWHSYRYVTQTDDSPAFLMEPDGKSTELEALKQAGFTQVSSYFSARVPLAETTQNQPAATVEFVIEPWDGENPEALFDQVFELSVQAFSKNAFYKSISREAFLAMYMPMVPLLKRELIFFARRPDQSLAGFLFGTPNYAEGPKPSSAILKTYASLTKGAGQHLAYAFHNAARLAGYKTAIHALIHDDNLSALRSASEGADVFRRYGLFGLKLNG